MARRVLATVVTLVVAATSLTGLESASAASEDAHVTASDVVFKHDACYDSDVAVTGLDPAVDHEVVVRGPSGGVVDTESASGRSDLAFIVRLCASVNTVGTHSVHVDGTSLATFDVTQPRIALERRSERLLLARLSLAGAPLPQRRVHVQLKRAGHWHAVLTLTTNRRGRVGVRCRAHHRCPERLRFEYRHFVYSPVFRLYSGSADGRTAVTSRMTSRTPVRSSLGLMAVR